MQEAISKHYFDCASPETSAVYISDTETRKTRNTLENMCPYLVDYAFLKNSLKAILANSNGLDNDGSL